MTDVPAFSPADTLRMREALALAEGAIGLCEPNPRVGCVIVAADGSQVLGRGHTQAAGDAHAEVVALRDAGAAASSLRGATAYVSLEPCSHHGRTPPCCDALIAAGLARVVVAVGDPNPLVAGEGIARLRAAGIQVDVGLLADEAREANLGFFSRMQRGRPWVRAKVAISLDGRTALPNGASQWITSPAARTDTHAWRRRAGAVLTGVGTVIDDDPRLDVRLVETPRQPWRVIVDSRLDTPPGARILDAPGQVLVYAAVPSPERGAALQARGVNELHVEAGAKLNGSFVREDLVDEWLVYVAPRLLGSGRDLAAFGPLQSLDQSVNLRLQAVDRIGPDLRLLLRRAGGETSA